MGIEKILATIIIGLPLCLIGVSINIFSKLNGIQDVYGIIIAISGVFITSLILPIIAIKLLVSQKDGIKNHERGANKTGGASS